MKTNRSFQRYLLLLAVFLGLSMSAQAQVQSDFEIKQGYQEQYQKLSNAIDKADSVAAIETTIENINTFESNYNKHSELLDKVLYPDTFQGEIEKLKTRAQQAHQRLQKLAKLEKQLKSGQSQLSSFQERIDKLTQKSESLSKQLKNSQQNERRLSGLVKRYRESIQQRDQLISTVTDSLFITYKNLDSESLSELRNAYQSSSMEQDNGIKMVSSIIDSNVQFLNNNTTLPTEGYLRLYAVQQQFADMWNTVGMKLSTIYSGDREPAEVKAEVDNKISQWETKVADGTWKSLNSAFSEVGIELAQFGDSDGFYNSLNDYVDNAIKATTDGGSKEARENYQTFVNFWNGTVKSQWGDYMVKSGVLSYQQIAEIDGKLHTWDKQSEPESNLMLILLGLAVLVIIVLGVLLARAKSGSGGSETRSTSTSKST